MQHIGEEKRYKFAEKKELVERCALRRDLIDLKHPSLVCCPPATALIPLGLRTTVAHCQVTVLIPLRLDIPVAHRPAMNPTSVALSITLPQLLIPLPLRLRIPVAHHPATVGLNTADERREDALCD